MVVKLQLGILQWICPPLDDLPASLRGDREIANHRPHNGLVAGAIIEAGLRVIHLHDGVGEPVRDVSTTLVEQRMKLFANASVDAPIGFSRTTVWAALPLP